MNPMTIQVRPLPTLKWKNRRAMEQLASALTALGYQDEGSHQIRELPHFQLQLFHHPTEAAFAMVLGSPEGVWAEFCSATQAGTGADFSSFTATNTSSPNVGLLDKPPGVVLRKFPGVSVKELDAELVQAGADLATDGPMALRAAAQVGHREVVEYLLGEGVPLDRDFTAALSVAAGHGHLEILELLFRAGASTSQAGKALQWAAVHGQYPAARWLVQRGVDPRNHPQYGTDLYFEQSKRPLLPERLAKEEGYPVLARFLAGKPVDEAQALAEVPVSQSQAERAAELSQLREALSGPRLEGAMREGAVLRILELIRSGEVGAELNAPDRRRGYSLTWSGWIGLSFGCN